MSSNKKIGLSMCGLVVALLAIDQAIKFYVKLHFALGEVYSIFPWFEICMVENNGMAFGLEVTGGKLFLTLFRIVAIAAVIWYMVVLIKQKARIGYIILVAFVLAGATGNLIDCLFYGLIFTESTPLCAADLVQFGSGYGDFLFGRVVDMFHFPLIHNSEGQELFFRPVFNFADSCITVAVFVIIIFYSKDLNLSFNTIQANRKNKADKKKNAE